MEKPTSGKLSLGAGLSERKKRLHPFQRSDRSAGLDFGQLLVFLALFSLPQSLGLNAFLSETSAPHSALTEFPRISLSFYVKGCDVEVSCAVLLDFVTVEKLTLQKLDHLTIIFPYTETVITFPPDPSGWIENYTSLFNHGNETEVKVSLDGLSEPSPPKYGTRGFIVHYTLSGVVKEDLLLINLSFKRSLNMQTPRIVELEAVTVRFWTTMPSWLKLLSSNIYCEESQVFDRFPVRYLSSFALFQSFPDVHHGSMNLSVEWRSLNPFEMYFLGLWGTAFLLLIYFVLSSLAFLVQLFRKPLLVRQASLGLLFVFLTYCFTVPVVYFWNPLTLMALGQFFHLPLVYYFARRFIRKPEGVEAVLRSSLYPSVVIFLVLLFLQTYYAT